MNCEGERDPSRTPQQERIQAVQKSLCNYKKSGPQPLTFLWERLFLLAAKNAYGSLKTLVPSRKVNSPGQETRWDAHMQARFYLPGWRRSASTDPARDQHFEETQSWNIYSYVQNNPVMKTDPNGETAWDVVKGMAYAITDNATLGAVGATAQKVFDFIPAGQNRDFYMGLRLVA